MVNIILRQNIFLSLSHVQFESLAQMYWLLASAQIVKVDEGMYMRSIVGWLLFISSYSSDKYRIKI